MDVMLSEITDILEQEFNYQNYQDSSLNGLQVESKATVSKIGAAVDYSESVVKKAADLQIDLLITHHGLFWGTPNPIVGNLALKLKTLFDYQINLVGIHLPLDAHPVFGNNVIIAKDILRLCKLQPAITYGTQKIGWKGENEQQFSIDQISNLFLPIDGALKHPLSLKFGPSIPQKICVVSGGAADALYQFKEEGFDTLITGEPRQFAYHFCKENQINAVFAGHYATETFGVRAISKYLASQFKLDYEFILEPTGI